MADGTIEFEREGGYYRDALRAYVIVVDGAAVGRVRAGERESVEVAAGAHEVYVHISRLWRSPGVRVEVPAGGLVRLRCRPGRTPAFGLLYTLLFRPERYLVLEPKALDDLE
jgi:hypothetical protein